MHVSRIRGSGGLALGFLLLLGCGGDGGDPPAISALTYGPDTIPSAQQSSVSGTLQFQDPDADLTQLGAAVTLPDGTVQELPLTALQGYAGQVTGRVTLTLTIVPPVAGTYGFEVWVIDAQDHASNRLEGTLHVP
jgi:hypothetical protein